MNQPIEEREVIDSLVRDFTQVIPRSKSEVRIRIENLLEQERKIMAEAIEMSKLGWIDEGRIEERKRMSDEIEKMKKTRFIGDTKSPTEDTEWISRNQALDEVLSIINN